MTTDSMTMESDATLFLGDAWSDPIEAGIRDRIRGFIEELIEEELATALGRRRYERRPSETISASAGSAAAMPLGETAASLTPAGYRHGHRSAGSPARSGRSRFAVPRARVGTVGGGTAEWKSRVLPRYARMTKHVEALIAGTYRHQYPSRAPGAGGVVQGDDRQGRSQPHLAESKDRLGGLVEAPARRGRHRPAILDGTVVRVRLDKKATSISLLVVLGVRGDGQKVLLAVKSGESEAVWRALLDDLVARGLKTPEFLIVDGAAGLEKALAALWPDLPTQRCTVTSTGTCSRTRRISCEISADYTDMIYAATPKEVEERRKSFLRKWRLKCRAVANSLEEAGGRLFTFTRLPSGQWRSARTSNAVERLHEEFKRRRSH